MATMVAVLGLLVVPAVVAAALLTMPRWSVRTIHRNQLWTIRDEVVDDIVVGRLPGAHKSVQTLVSQLETAADECPRFTMLGLYAYRRALRKNRDTARVIATSYMRSKNTDGLSRDERDRVESYRERLQNVLYRNLLLGSWVGMLYFAMSFLSALTRREQPQSGSAPRSQPIRGEGKLRKAPRSGGQRTASENRHAGDRVDEWVNDICLPGVANRGAARMHALR